MAPVSETPARPRSLVWSGQWVKRLLEVHLRCLTEWKLRREVVLQWATDVFFKISETCEYLKPKRKRSERETVRVKGADGR